MLITKNFVLLNNPKTGSTFARKAIQDVLENRGIKILNKLIFHYAPTFSTYQQIKLQNVRFPNLSLKPSQHGGYCQIPYEHKDKFVFSIVRHPVSKLISAYKYQSWTRQPKISADHLTSIFPHFPELNFKEFLQYTSLVAQKECKNWNLPIDLGPQTLQFIWMFFKEPITTLKNMTPSFFSNREYASHLGPLHFIRQENLVQELITTLEQFNFSKKELSRIKEFSPRNLSPVTNGSGENMLAIATDFVYQNERVLLNIYSELDIYSSSPSKY